MKTLLIAVNSAYLREALQEDLADRYRVLTCTDGAQALAIIDDAQPDIMIIDPALRNMDGAAVLREAADAEAQPAVLMISGYLGENILHLLADFKLCCALRPPISYERVMDCLLAFESQLDNAPYAVQRYSQCLARLGFKMNTAGARTVLTALQVYGEDPRQKVTLQLYPKVAQLCGGTSQQVEKAIRSAIEAAWKQNNKQWLAFFPADKHGRPIRPTNAAFLSRIIMQTQPGEAADSAAAAV